MCGIGIILSGLPVICSGCGENGEDLTTTASVEVPTILPTSYCQDLNCQWSACPQEDLLLQDADSLPTVNSLATALTRRGPDSIGFFSLSLPDILGFTDSLQSADRVEDPLLCGGVHFVGATLQLRGNDPVTQPLLDEKGNILLFNGEIFGGLQVEPHENDGQVLLKALSSNEDVPAVLSRLRGPWSLVYWQAASSQLWYGRDAIGRRSLLVHRPSNHDARFLLTSVASPGEEKDETKDNGESSGQFHYWKEVPGGVYSLALTPVVGRGYSWCHLAHAWRDPLLTRLTTGWRQQLGPEPCIEPGGGPGGRPSLAHCVGPVLEALSEAVRIRVQGVRQGWEGVAGDGQWEAATSAAGPVGVLFSGGLDSMLLAVLADRHLAPSFPIQLLNVSFVGPTAPDRKTAIAGLEELRHLSPSRRWHLVEVDASLGEAEEQRQHLLSLLCPSCTHMDFNIGAALWLAAAGGGGSGGPRVLLVGSGADEQCGGYARYRTKFKAGGWSALREEMALDVKRLWQRNLGRDDRCIADRGKEARFPFLDESVMSLLMSLPLDVVVDLRLPLGVGDKQILREVARGLGIRGASTLPKRAIQFGSRIAQESNMRNFGSNRAANQVNAGGMVIADLT